MRSSSIISRTLLDEPQIDCSLYRRQDGREEPWLQIAADDDAETYVTPVHARPGRYLWVVLKLAGTTSVSPRGSCRG